jgi:hypothetical protein
VPERFFGEKQPEKQAEEAMNEAYVPENSLGRPRFP